MRFVSALLLTGCFSKPARPDGDASVDAGTCQPSSARDDFENSAAAPCGAGLPGGSAPGNMARSGGVLTMSPPAMGDCSCTFPNFDFSTGVFVEVIATTGPVGTYTILQIDTPNVMMNVDDFGTAKLILAEQQTNLVEVDYDPVAMRWWRLRPRDGNVVGEYSADGLAWTVLGVSAGAAPAQTAVSINAGSYSTGSPLTAMFDNLGVCPN